MKKKQFNKKQIATIDSFRSKIEEAEDLFYQRLVDIENEMRAQTQIKDLEIFMIDGCIAGVGNQSRSFALYQFNIKY